MVSLGQELFAEIASTARKNGALMTGLTHIRRVEPVLVFAFPFTDAWFLHHFIPVTSWLGKEYLESKHVQNLTARLLQREGFQAEYKTVMSLFGDFRPLAVAAGLGTWGRNGLVVNKQHGAGMLFSAIFTDAPLEMEVAESVVPEVAGHCTDCGACVAACPVRAFDGGGLSVTRCSAKVARGCSECLRVCAGGKTT